MSRPSHQPVATDGEDAARVDDRIRLVAGSLASDIMTAYKALVTARPQRRVGGNSDDRPRMTLLIRAGPPGSRILGGMRIGALAATCNLSPAEHTFVRSAGRQPTANSTGIWGYRLE